MRVVELYLFQSCWKTFAQVTTWPVLISIVGGSDYSIRPIEHE